MNQPVTPAMIAALHAHFRGGSVAPKNHALAVQRRFRVDYDVDAPVALQLPDFQMDPTIVGTDGSSSDVHGVGGYAAVRGDGAALFGAFSGPIVNSHTCEAQGIRFGLRLAPDDSNVLIRLDSYSVIDEVYRVIGGGEIRNSPVRDWDALNEITWHLDQRGVQLALQRIPDAEGGTNPHRIPSDPLMGTAHRLAWSARRLRLSAVPAQGAALEWLYEVATSGVRWSTDMHAAWHDFARATGIEEGEGGQ